MRTSIEAISVSAGAADAFVALGLKEVDLFKKGFGTAFILCAERAEWFELRDQRVGRSFGIVQVVLRVLSYTRCSRELNRWHQPDSTRNVVQVSTIRYLKTII